MHNIKRHIFITGFMGCGKSTVGQHLAALLNRPLIDMDAEIARKFKMPVHEIFSTHGEAAFRHAENVILRKIASNSAPQVVATGGGSVVDNHSLMDDSGIRIFLNTPLPIIKRRLALSTQTARPLWKNDRQLEELFSQRQATYQSAVTHVAGDDSPANIAHNLAQLFFMPMQASLLAMGVNCSLQIAWPNSFTALDKELARRNNYLLLDRALRHQAVWWQQRGCKVQVMQRRGEALKTMQQAHKVLQLMLAEKLARDDYLIVRGGGSLTDMGAFCAGLYKRGLNLILIATTLLAAVDAAIGGKTAINFNGQKNQVGHFYLPRKVIIDVASFASLKPSHLADGLIEAYKTGLIADEELAHFIEDNLNALKKGDIPYLAWVAGRAMQAKCALVQKDFREQRGLRDVLNLGHTFGHVVESCSNYQTSHGQAVAAGLITAIRLSQQKAGLAPAQAQRIINNVARISKIPLLPAQHLVEDIMRQDKKYRSNKLGFVLLKKPGQAVLTHNLSLQDVLAATYGANSI